MKILQIFLDDICFFQIELYFEYTRTNISKNSKDIKIVKKYSKR